MNYIAFFGYILISLFFFAGAYLSYSSGNLPFAGLAALLGLLGLYALWDGFRKGLRAPNRYEGFKYWMSLRPILFGLLGIGALAAFAFYGRDWFGEAVFESTPVMATAAVLAIIYLVLIIFFAMRAPYRSENDESYKARIGWKD